MTRLKPSVVPAFAVVFVAALGARACSHQPPTLQDAHRAFISHDLRRAVQLYEAVAAADTLPATGRGRALRRLASLAWRFRLEPDSGRTLLKSALGLGVDSSATFAELARLETRAGQSSAATAAAEAALGSAQTTEDRLRAVARLAAVAVEPACDTLFEAGRWPEGPSLSRLRAALASVQPTNAAVQGLLETSELQLSAALFLDDGAAALDAWRSYYLLHLTREGPLPGALDTLSRVLPNWSGAAASDASRVAAVIALAASGLYDAALILATDPRATDRVDTIPLVADIVAYARTLRHLRPLTDEYYRATSIGKGDAKAYRRQLFGQAEALWDRLTWPNGPPPFSEDSVAVELQRRFGAEIRLGKTAGYFDLHLGHAVVDEPRVVEQYGQRVEVRFIALDGIVSNGFQSWAWDGEQAHGGWADANTIVQVRPGYAAAPLGVWRALTDSVEAARRREERTADSIADIPRAVRDPYAYLPGLAARMVVQGVLALRDSLTAAGLSGGELRAAFLAAYDHARVESSIFAHEGRHAIDRRMDLDLEPWESEYRAKLSEAVFAPQPRFALSAMLNANIGSDTPHGQANLRIVEGLVSWLDSHRAEIAGFDSALPVLPQLSRLTDEQLREAFRAMDPLATSSRPQP